MYRQGDILLIPVGMDEPCAAAIGRDGDGSLTLAVGEATNHRHRFVDDPHVTMFAHKTRASDRVLKVVGNVAFLRHDEHAPIQVPPGTYRIVRQTEWTDAHEPRVVQD